MKVQWRRKIERPKRKISLDCDCSKDVNAGIAMENEECAN